MIDDSDDEVFITRLYFRRERIDAGLRHFVGFEEFKHEIDAMSDLEQQFCLLVVDLNLRSSRGTDVIKQVRSESWGDAMIAGICSGSEDPADREAALASGADFYVTKPLNRIRIEGICAADSRLEASVDGDQPLTIWRTDGAAPPEDRRP